MDAARRGRTMSQESWQPGSVLHGTRDRRPMQSLRPRCSPVVGPTRRLVGARSGRRDGHAERRPAADHAARGRDQRGARPAAGVLHGRERPRRARDVRAPRATARWRRAPGGADAADPPAPDAHPAGPGAAGLRVDGGGPRPDCPEQLAARRQPPVGPVSARPLSGRRPARCWLLRWRPIDIL